MESVPRAHVEWIDEIVFPEGLELALNLHLDAARFDATSCSPEQASQGPEPAPDVTFSHLVQSGATRQMVEAAGIEPSALPLEAVARVW